MKYQTKFSLTNCVNNIDLAKKYFSQKDMTAVLNNDINLPQNIKDIVEKIEWVLEDNSSGYIELTTNIKLSDIYLKYLNHWVHKQCKDGLGEDFRQQDFSYYDDIGLIGYEGSDWDNSLVIAEFNWENDDYSFIEIN